jgi:DNA-binding response OmpR family regulator
MLVEDCADDEFLTLRAIAKSGIPCNVTVRRDGEAAVSHLLDEESPVPALVLLDFSLPKRTGLEILKVMRVHDRTRCVPVVIFSGESSSDKPIACFRDGANSWVPKPSDPAEYESCLTQVARYWLTINYLTSHLHPAPRPTDPPR